MWRLVYAFKYVIRCVKVCRMSSKYVNQACIKYEKLNAFINLSQARAYVRSLSKAFLQQLIFVFSLLIF